MPLEMMEYVILNKEIQIRANTYPHYAYLNINAYKYSVSFLRRKVPIKTKIRLREKCIHELMNNL